LIYQRKTTFKRLNEKGAIKMITKKINNWNIKRLKKKLNKAITNKHLLDSEVYKISIKLDKYIVKYYK